MSSDNTDETTDSEVLAPKTITERFNNLEPGDKLTVNNHEVTYEVVDTDTYSVIVEDPNGQRASFSQNLQSGGWMLNEEVFHVATETE